MFGVMYYTAMADWYTKREEPMFIKPLCCSRNPQIFLL